MLNQGEKYIIFKEKLQKFPAQHNHNEHIEKNRRKTHKSALNQEMIYFIFRSCSGKISLLTKTLHPTIVSEKEFFNCSSQIRKNYLSR